MAQTTVIVSPVTTTPVLTANSKSIESRLQEWEAKYNSLYDCSDLCSVPAAHQVSLYTSLGDFCAILTNPDVRCVCTCCDHSIHVGGIVW